MTTRPRMWSRYPGDLEWHCEDVTHLDASGRLARIAARIAQGYEVSTADPCRLNDNGTGRSDARGGAGGVCIDEIEQECGAGSATQVLRARSLTPRTCGRHPPDVCCERCEPG